LLLVFGFRDIPEPKRSTLQRAETNQLGRLTWLERARAGSPKRPLPGVATEGPHRATAPVGTQSLIQTPWQLVTGCKAAMWSGNNAGLCTWVLENIASQGCGLRKLGRNS